MVQVLHLVFLISVASCNVIIESQNPPEATDEWWKSGVFYQIYPRSFQDSDGDGEGDIRGITSKLEHLKNLGITGAWLSPVFKSPMRDGGYDISTFTELNPMFGTNDDLVELFQKARDLGKCSIVA
jgi:alpha-glucosidase